MEFLCIIMKIMYVPWLNSLSITFSTVFPMSGPMGHHLFLNYAILEIGI